MESNRPHGSQVLMRIRCGQPRAALLRVVLLAIPVAGIASAQAPEIRRLTLEEAERAALAAHPRITSARLTAEATATQVRQVRSRFQPQLSGDLTTVGAERGTAIAAGTLQTSGLASRAATGLGVSQLLLDFGRTSSLADSARLRASAQDQSVNLIRAQVLLQVDQAYYRLLAAGEVLSVARARVEMQRLTLRQVEALANSGLKSTLDVSFAQVAVSEAELALYQAENAANESHALLAASMGETASSRFELADVPLPAQLTGGPEPLVEEALRNRPDLASIRLNQSAAQRFAEAEKKLRYPSVSAVAVVGTVPLHQDNFSGQYSAAGLNISVPFLNGGLNSARRAEAELRARGIERDAQALAVQVSADVRVAWMQADTAWQRIGLTAKLVDQANTSLRLARARYDIGLSGIIELTQAQLALTTAQIASANARFDYLYRIAALRYATGDLR